MNNLIQIKNLKDNESIEEVGKLLIDLIKNNEFSLDIKVKYNQNNYEKINNCINTNGITELKEININNLNKIEQKEDYQTYWHKNDDDLNDFSNPFYFLNSVKNKKYEETLILENFDELPKKKQFEIKNTILKYTNPKNVNIVENLEA